MLRLTSVHSHHTQMFHHYFILFIHQRSAQTNVVSQSIIPGHIHKQCYTKKLSGTKTSGIVQGFPELNKFKYTPWISISIWHLHIIKDLSATWKDVIKAQKKTTSADVISCWLHREKTKDVLMLLHSASSARRRRSLPKWHLRLLVLHTHTHTHTHTQPFYGRLSGTTLVGRYQETFTHPHMKRVVGDCHHSGFYETWGR